MFKNFLYYLQFLLGLRLFQTSIPSSSWKKSEWYCCAWIIFSFLKHVALYQDFNSHGTKFYRGSYLRPRSNRFCPLVEYRDWRTFKQHNATVLKFSAIYCQLQAFQQSLILTIWTTIQSHRPSASRSLRESNPMNTLDGSLKKMYVPMAGHYTHLDQLQ